jgi:hypothetical protein
LWAAIVILAIAMAGLAAWVVHDPAGETVLPSEVEEVIDGFVRAVEEGDGVAFRAITTDDFTDIGRSYEQRLGAVAGDLVVGEWSLSVAEYVAYGSDWEVEQIGQPIVSGDGPWFVAVEENWFECLYEDAATGLCGLTIPYEGTANYMVVEENGTFKIAHHFWSGLLSYETD